MSSPSIETTTNRAGDAGNIEDVPDISVAWYRQVLSFAHETPGWFQGFAALFTEGVLVLFALALLISCRRAWSRDARTMSRALLAPMVTVVAYTVSEWAKTLTGVERPCRTLPDVTPLVACPPLGDFSLPSNHATVAGAVAVGLLLTWRAWGLAILPVATLAAFSRVFVGVHYPHDAVAGFLLGMLVELVLVTTLTHPGATLIRRVGAVRGAPSPT